METVFKIYFLLAVFYVLTAYGQIDRPCMPRKANDSYICVCNSSYCDEITREKPVSGKYFTYVTSKSGQRLQKTSASLQITSNINHLPVDDTPVLVLDPSKRYQYIEGYGGAVTDSASINYNNLVNEQLKKYLIESYFGSKGIEYNMIRVPIGGCDFSTRQYAYNELPENDVKLTNFSLAYEDTYYKIPMIKDAMQVAAAPIHVLASTWSPPLRLRKEYFQTYADYHLKYLLPAAVDDTPVLVLDPSKRYQYIEGYGGAVTDSASINYNNLVNEQLKKYLIESYFGSKGIEYNMIRVPIGGCDFSTRQYAYNELPENDVKLTNFSLAYEDTYYKIPMIKDAMQVAAAPIHVLASTWSPPLWMKDPSIVSGLNRLRKEYFQTYADYHLKFIEKYAENCIPIWGVTTTNEPLSGVMSLGHNNRLGWSTKAMGKWIANNLGPTLRNSKYNVKILIGDDQRFTVPLWFNVAVQETPDALNYIDGVAVHFYFDDVNPPDILSVAMKDYPDKFILYTESCVGAQETPSVLLGSWKRATKYIQNIIEDLNYNVTGWIDWNLCLNDQGGPNYIDNYVDSPIIVFPDNGEFVKQPLFYAMAHFSKFMPRGSQRIDVTQANSCPSIDNVAVVTPDNNIVTVLHNKDNTRRQVKLVLGRQQAVVLLEPNSLVTVEFPNY